ncbi:MAG TPA: hypothetical protein ENN46_00970 [Candidatus Woesearchaeota archaeon]|nr:hypothetical protein [Candidatus Woesearchaeota archaeon]
MNNKKTKIKASIMYASLLMLVMFVFACYSPQEPKGLGQDPDLSPSGTFATREEYITFVKESGTGYYAGGGVLRSVMVDDMMMFDADFAMAMPESAEKTLDFSETNIQVEGVNEGDILKTDGNYIYTITEKTLFIIKAYPGEDAEVISRTAFRDQPTGLFIKGDRLAVFGDIQDPDIFDNVGIRVRNGLTFVSIYDISDRENPKHLEDFRFEGKYVNSRMIDSQVYIVTGMYPEFRIIHPMPIVIEGGVVGEVAPRDIFHFGMRYDSPYMTGVHSVDIESIEKLGSKIVTTDGTPTVYMSQNNLYLASTKSISYWEISNEVGKEIVLPLLPGYYKSIIEKIQETDSDVLSYYEKERKIQEIIGEYVSMLPSDEQQELSDKVEDKTIEKMKEYEYPQFTSIIKLSANRGEIEVADKGSVPGRINNQFSMDEHKGNLRIATTIQPSWEWRRYDFGLKESINNVYVLDRSLDIIGRLEGLAEGESIFSARFMGNRLYMVTFRQIDPFFVIDLSNPRNPKDLGELKIPGFSRYLHPYDENTIIGIGRDATETGREIGLKISLFDVTDVENPVKTTKFVSDQRYMQSTAEWEHKAFLFSRDRNLLVIPVYSFGGRFMDDMGRWIEDESYNGAFVFNISKDSIELRGLIDHDRGEGSSRHYYRPSVERSLYINELLYTKSPYLLRINKLSTLESVKDVALETVKQAGDIPVY